MIAVSIAASLAAAPLVMFSTTANAAPGTKSLASVLLKDTTNAGNPKFDDNGKDFDILTAAVLAVLADDPGSPVSVLTDGDVTLTAFLPTDNAFRRTGNVLDITARNEERLAGKYVDALGVSGVEAVLLYHVVPGAKINANAAAEADGVELETALGQDIEVNVTRDGIFIKDMSDARDPKVIIPDINKGNKQIGHGINRVLLPAL
jgi:hypothetical protein